MNAGSGLAQSVPCEGAEVASMAKRTPRKSPGKRAKQEAPDPRQLGLFDAADTPIERTTPGVKQTSIARTKRARSSIVERPVVLSAREAAQYLGVSVSTLKSWRAKNIGPRSIKRGARLVAYRPADLERFLDDSSAKR